MPNLLKSIMIKLFILQCFFYCTELEQADQDQISIKDIPGTVKLQLPVKWDIGKTGGTWRSTDSTELRSYNPFASLEGTAYEVIRTINDYMFDYDMETNEWTGVLVKKYEIKMDKEKDSLELICELKDDIYYHDGVQMTADDIVFFVSELDTDKDIHYRGYKSSLVKMDDGTEKQIKIEKIDKFKFKYIFPRIVANPILNINTYILPKHIWEPVKKKGKDAIMKFWDVKTPPSEIIGSGPYIIEEYKAVERFVFKGNPKYYRKDEKGNTMPYREKLVYSYVTRGNTTAVLLKFQKGESESYGLRGIDMATLLPEAEKKGYDIWNGGPSFRYTGLLINQNPKKVDKHLHKLFINKKFRYAISCLVDRETIINQVMNGFAEAYYHFTADNNKYHSPEFTTPYKYDPEKAKQLLAEIGLKDTNNDGYLEDEEGNTITFKVMIYGTDQTIIDTNNIIIDDLNKAGLKAVLETLDYNVWAEKLQYTFDWEFVLLGFNCPTFTEQYSNVWPSDGDRHYWYPNQEKPATEWEARIDEIYAKIIHTYDETEVKKLYDEFQQIIMDNLPIIPLTRAYNFIAIYKKWGNVNWDNRHEFGGLSGVRLYLKDMPVQ